MSTEEGQFLSMEFNALNIKCENSSFMLRYYDSNPRYEFIVAQYSRSNNIEITKIGNCWYIHSCAWWGKTKLGYDKDYPDFSYLKTEIIGLDKILVRYINLIRDFFNGAVSVKDFSESLEEINSIKLLFRENKRCLKT